MRLSSADLVAWCRTDGGRRKVRYTAASVLSAVTGQVALLVAFGLLHWSAAGAAVFSFMVGALSSYHLNRMWVWGRDGRSDVLREVVPFWVVAAVSLAISTALIVAAERTVAGLTASHSIRTAVVMAASVASIIPVWLVKYLVLDRYVFAGGADRSYHSDEARTSERV